MLPKSVVVFNVSDLQIDHLDRRGAFKNPIVDGFLHPADRNVISTQTHDVYLTALLNKLSNRYPQTSQRISVLGDVADTPHIYEMQRLTRIIAHYSDVQVNGYTRGNHSSGIFSGVVNPNSAHYDSGRRLPILFGGFTLDEHLEGNTQNPGNILTPCATMEAGREMVYVNRSQKPKPIKDISCRVDKADGQGYTLLPSPENSPPTLFSPQNLTHNFQTFWKEASVADNDLPLWECVINHDIADERDNFRGTQVNPIYLQAVQTACFTSSDGHQYPLYTINIDGLDHTNLFASKGAGISEFQTRLIETFMDQKIRENPRARFKFNSHFSAQDDIVNTPWYMPWRKKKYQKSQEAFRKLLMREEIILYTFGHTHERNYRDLNETLKLGRATPLMELNVPSLIDHHPYLDENTPECDGRAIAVEEYQLVETADGKKFLEINISFEGLDPEDLTEEDGRTPHVDAVLQQFTKDHGYLRIHETVKMLRNRHIIGWSLAQAGRLQDFIWKGFLLAFYSPKDWWAYWGQMSLAQYALDNLTVVSTVNMFNEAYHLMAFMKSVTQLISDDEEPAQLAIKAQIEGLRVALMEEYVPRRHRFEEDLSNGERASSLKHYNDLFERAQTHQLTDLLSALSPKSPARAFAILAGIEASRQEYVIEKRPKAIVPNRLPTLSIPMPG